MGHYVLDIRYTSYFLIMLTLIYIVRVAWAHQRQCRYLVNVVENVGSLKIPANKKSLRGNYTSQKNSYSEIIVRGARAHQRQCRYWTIWLMWQQMQDLEGYLLCPFLKIFHFILPLPVYSRVCYLLTNFLESVCIDCINCLEQIEQQKLLLLSCTLISD